MSTKCGLICVFEEVLWSKNEWMEIFVLASNSKCQKLILKALLWLHLFALFYEPIILNYSFALNTNIYFNSWLLLLLLKHNIQNKKCHMRQTNNIRLCYDNAEIEIVIVSPVKSLDNLRLNPRSTLGNHFLSSRAISTSTFCNLSR